VNRVVQLLIALICIRNNWSSQTFSKACKTQIWLILTIHTNQSRSSAYDFELTMDYQHLINEHCNITNMAFGGQEKDQIHSI